MDHGTNKSEPNLNGLFGRTSSIGSSRRRRSSTLSRGLSFQIDDDIESENVSEAGDIGDRAIQSKKHSESGSLRLSIDNGLENGVVLPVPEGFLLQSSHDFRGLNSASPEAHFPEEIISPLSSDAIVCSKDQKEDKEKALVMPPLLEYLSCLLYLAVFGILGAIPSIAPRNPLLPLISSTLQHFAAQVLTRYLLQKLFGPGIAGVTSDHYPLYLDLPSNMVGSFLMGWCGVVFKGDISSVSDHLAIGLTTGYLGSLTTFSGWNQKMLDLSVDGHWVFSFVGFLIGLFLVAYSIKFGVGTAKCFRLLLQRLNKSSNNGNWRVHSRSHHLVVMVVLVLMLGLLWSISGTLLKEEFNGNSGAQLWLACIVAPPGVWIRWFLARLNGRGLGEAGSLKWVPFGTLIANVSAACIMAAMSTLKKAVHSKTCDTISTGIQFGFLGCLSTVSTFIAEYNAMEESNESWRAYVYALMTIVSSFGLGILIYSVPVWTGAYNKLPAFV